VVSNAIIYSQTYKKVKLGTSIMHIKKIVIVRYLKNNEAAGTRDHTIITLFCKKK